VETAPAIQFSEVVKSFGTANVLAGLSLVVHPGEMFALVGANGAGKSTSIKAMLDFTSINAGTITLFGQPHDEAQARRCLAFLPERFQPPYFLGGREYLRSVAALLDEPYDESTACSMCAALDLAANALDQSVRTYSKGMAQKLGLAGVLLSKRQLLVLDEPLSGLDAKARILAKRELERAAQQGRTVFFTSHMLADVEALSNRMGILHAGTAAFEGTAAECCEAYGAVDLEAAFLRLVDG
jgi:ABC-2 type transport system ATP-binding protein